MNRFMEWARRRGHLLLAGFCAASVTSGLGHRHAIAEDFYTGTPMLNCAINNGCGVGTHTITVVVDPYDTNDSLCGPLGSSASHTCTTATCWINLQGYASEVNCGR